MLAIGLTLWAAPLAAARYFAGEESALYRAGIFFSKAAVVTFGGAYSVLAYIAQQAVENYQWLTPREMVDGLGFAETTPGPLIMVVQFVGFMGVYRNPGALSPLTAGLLGSALTVWVTFVPSFLWIFLGRPSCSTARTETPLRGPLRHHRRRGGGDFESCDLVRAACVVSRHLDREARPRAGRTAAAGDIRFAHRRRHAAGNRAGVCRQTRNANHVGGVRRHGPSVMQTG